MNIFSGFMYIDSMLTRTQIRVKSQEMYENGAFFSEIGKLFHIHKNTVSRWARTENWVRLCSQRKKPEVLTVEKLQRETATIFRNMHGGERVTLESPEPGKKEESSAGDVESKMSEEGGGGTNLSTPTLLYSNTPRDPLQLAEDLSFGLEFMIQASISHIQSWCLSFERTNLKTGEVKLELVPIDNRCINWERKKVRFRDEDYSTEDLVPDTKLRAVGLKTFIELTGASPKIRAGAIAASLKAAALKVPEAGKVGTPAAGGIQMLRPKRKTIEEAMNNVKEPEDSELPDAQWSDTPEEESNTPY